MRAFIRFTHMVLLAISIGFFVGVVYNAVQGRDLDLTSLRLWGVEPGALIVAIVLTGTWIVEGLSLRFRLPEGRHDWFMTAGVMVVAILVDCGITLAFIFGLHIPERLPLFVTIAHAATQAARWTIASYQRESKSDGMLQVGYEPAEARLAIAEAELVLTRKMLTDGIARLESVGKHYATCSICNRQFEGSSVAAAQEKVARHITRTHPNQGAQIMLSEVDMPEYVGGWETN
jgi:hypothetical protein